MAMIMRRASFSYPLPPRGGGLGWGVAAIALLAVSSTATAEPVCKGAPEIRECRVFDDAVVYVRTLDGTLAFSTEYSSTARWWPVTGQRAMPSALFYSLRANPTAVLHGDFEVCFRGNRPAAPEETLCVESGKNVAVRIPQYD